VSRDMNGRYGYRLARVVGDSVAVTCEECARPTRGELYISTSEPDRSWRTWTVYRCAGCGPELWNGVPQTGAYPHVIACAWCRRRCHVSHGRRYCTPACTIRAHRSAPPAAHVLADESVLHVRHSFTTSRRDGAYCSNACRQRAYRQRPKERARQAEAVRIESGRHWASLDSEGRHAYVCNCGGPIAGCVWWSDS